MEQIHYWIQDLLEGIENSDNPETGIGILRGCGGNCAKRNVLPGMDGLKRELSGLHDTDKISLVISQYTGAECIPADDGFTLIYNRGKGCDCALVCEGYVKAPVFCNCTLGFHETVWSTIFERPVRVELLETFLRGGNCCAYKISFDK